MAAIVLVGTLLALLLIWPLAEGVRGRSSAATASSPSRTSRPCSAIRSTVEGLRNALAIAVFSTAIAGVFGIGCALLLHRYQFPGRRLLAALVPLPLMVPPFVGAVGMKYLLGRAGALNALLERLGVGDPSAPIDWLREGRFAVVVALTALHLYPIVYFNVQAALAGLNAEMEEAARSLGCRGLRLFRKVTLPSILPSVFAAGSIVFIWAFTELGVPLMCDFQRVTSVQIFTGPQGPRPQPVRLRAGRGRPGDDGGALCVRALAGGAYGRPPRRRRQGRARAHRPRRLRPLAGALVAGDHSPPSSASPRCPTSAWCCWRCRATGTARSCRRG